VGVLDENGGIGIHENPGVLFMIGGNDLRRVGSYLARNLIQMNTRQ
jgi:hypothetical protein